jgi:2-keto-4-pentenoate hydratase/2-oxohepta-3-ene-1,7-dioic acid hydratase in catechol pathway
MRFATVATPAGPVAAVERDGQFYRLGSSLRESLEAGSLEQAAATATEVISFSDDDLLPVIPDPSKILCVGRNYLEHVEELGNKVTKAPEIFLRVPTSLARPFGPVINPSVSERFDWEVELAIVIGQPGRHISEADAFDHIAGYTVFNDFTARDYQRATSQWTPGKNFDQTGPLGPYLLTPDEIGDPAALDISLSIDGLQMQSSNTKMLIHTIPAVIKFLSTFCTLRPGDVIATGTPGGVGDGRDPKVFLRNGQVVLSSVEGVGEIRNVVQAEKTA